MRRPKCADEKYGIERRALWAVEDLIMLDKFVAVTSSLLELSVFFAAGGVLVVGLLLLR